LRGRILAPQIHCHSGKVEAIMSKFVKVKTQLRDVALVKQALDDLQIHYEENQQYTHFWSKQRTAVPILISNGGGKFGLCEDADGIFEMVGDDMQMRRMRSLMDRVQQRYAYNKVLTETKSAGFNLVEESVGDDNVIRMTVRRWS
jgi:hypothetical protein